MKKYLLAAALVMVSASAMADEVSGSREGKSKADACEGAKVNARAEARGHDIEHYSACDCDKQVKPGPYINGVGNAPSYDWWSCTVNARVKED